MTAEELLRALANREITTSEFNLLSADLIGRLRRDRRDRRDRSEHMERRALKRRFFAIAMVPPVVVFASACAAGTPAILAVAAIFAAGELGRWLARSILDRRYQR